MATKSLATATVRAVKHRKIAPLRAALVLVNIYQLMLKCIYHLIFVLYNLTLLDSVSCAKSETITCRER